MGILLPTLSTYEMKFQSPYSRQAFPICQMKLSQGTGSQTKYGSNRSRSRVSVSTSLVSERAKAAARKAALQAESAALKERQRLAQEELDIKHRKEALDLGVNLAMAEAEDQAYQDMTGISQISGRRQALPPRGRSDLPLVDPTPPPPGLNTNASVFRNRDNSDVALLETMQATQQQQQYMLSVMQLPKVELKTFDGDPLQYWVFIRAFENTVERDLVDDNAKLARLLQYCVGRAYKVIEGCAVMEASQGYTRAKQLLKERFGNDFYITEAWVQNITQGQYIKANDRAGLQDFADNLKSCREVLNAMNRSSEMNNQTNLVRIIEKLPVYLQNRWKKQVRDIRKRGERVPGSDDVVEFVSAASEEANDPVYGKLTDNSREKINGNKFQRPPKGRGRSNFSVMADQSGTNVDQQHANDTVKRCVFCEAEHTLLDCDGFKSLKPEERLKFSRRKKLCDNCLWPGHMSATCRRKTVCTVAGCGRKHSKFLHVSKREVHAGDQNTSLRDAVNDQTQTDVKAVNGYSHSEESLCSATGAGAGRVGLPIVRVNVMTIDGRCTVSTCALLDSGSTSTFCSASLAKRLGIKGKREKLTLTTLTSTSSSVSTEVKGVKVCSLEDQAECITVPKVFVRAQMSINGDNIAKQKDADRWSHLNGIKLPEVNEEVELLIGQDVPEVMIPLDVKHGNKGEPYAVKNVLGWTLNGPLNGSDSSKSSNAAHSNFTQVCSLENQVKRFWELEACDIMYNEKMALSVDDQRVLSIWDETVNKVNGHYQMAIPFKDKVPHLPNNRKMALRRLESLKTRLQRDKDLNESYCAEIQNLFEQGFAEEVPKEEIVNGREEKVWYLPHHPVLHPQKPGKVRIVFDCAAKYNNTSLNDKVLQGPDLMNSLIGVLLRFRQEPVALMADVEGMFNQVLVDPKDRDVLRFLWWKDDNLSEEPQEYRMKTHIFGGVWSPSCANYALKRTAEDERVDFDPYVLDTVKQDFYVDDLLKSVSSVDQAIPLVANLREVLARGGFRLTKWVSNSKAVLKSIPGSELAKGVKDVDLEQESLPVERVLGVHWDIASDCFEFKTVTKDKPLTRRGLLSVISSIYDPLGVTTPFVLPAKLILQELCRKNLQWDEAIPDMQLCQWKKWVKDLQLLEDFKVERCIKPKDDDVAHCTLHHFSDASLKAYGVVSYLHVERQKGEARNFLVMAKSRLAPIKAITVPRSELAAATLAVRQDQLLRRELTIPLRDSVFWTDSEIVLRYIANENKRFSIYVANRVAVIHDHTASEQWHYVNTEQNPADDVSRGLSARELLESNRWLNGPGFLSRNEDEWPESPSLQDIPYDDPEVKTKADVYAVSHDAQSVDCLFQRYSSWHALKKGVAWMLRLRAFLKNKVVLKRKDHGDLLPENKGSISVEELQAAERYAVSYVQGQCFASELATLKRSGKVNRSSSIVKLDPVVIQGILCVRGRMSNAVHEGIGKYQMILPKNHHITDLIVGYYHQLSAHAGCEHVLSLVRQKFWIVKGRQVINQGLKHCILCKRRAVAPCKQKMADLPDERVTPDEPPFTFVGIDYFGPFQVKRGRVLVKRYGYTFTCLASRAVHIEVASNLETDSFINALTRFLSRRGRPKMIISDNGTNFRGAQKELRDCIEAWNVKQVEEYLLQREIKWRFIPPMASHMGGVWERQIQTIRKVLGGLFKEQCMDDEGLHTLLCKVESIVNSRPLTKASNDPKDDEPLTPNHILLLNANTPLPPGIFERSDVYPKRRWRQVQYLSNLFWTRWMREYLAEQQSRQKWFNRERNMTVNDLVLLVDQQAPRHVWPLGHVLQTFPGRDGRVRSVRVRTQSGEFIRPIHKLCLLEASRNAH